MNHASPSLTSRLASYFLRPSVGTAPPATLALRAAVGGVFLASGLVKFLFVNNGAGRFAKIGLPAPEQLAGFVGTVEIVGGALIVLGLFTRLAAVPLIINMVVAIATTKVPLLFGPGPEPVAAMPKIGFWAFAYQARLDVTMLVAAGYLLVVGAGLWSIDGALSRRRFAKALLASVLQDEPHAQPSVDHAPAEPETCRPSTSQQAV
jgi:putative oxidoreductase